MGDTFAKQEHQFEETHTELNMHCSVENTIIHQAFIIDFEIERIVQITKIVKLNCIDNNHRDKIQKSD